MSCDHGTEPLVTLIAQRRAVARQSRTETLSPRARQLKPGNIERARAPEQERCDVPERNTAVGGARRRASNPAPGSARGMGSDPRDAAEQAAAPT